MRKLVPFLFSILTLPLAAQVNNPSIVSVTSAPSGSCKAGLPNRQVKSTGTQYSCQSVVAGVGTWGAIAAGGDTITSPGATITVGGTAASTTLDTKATTINGQTCTPGGSCTVAGGALANVTSSVTCAGDVGGWTYSNGQCIANAGANGGGAILTISGVPQTGRTLQVRMMGRNDSGSVQCGWVHFNTDSGSNYFSQTIQSYQSSINPSYSSTSTSQPIFGCVTGSTTSSGPVTSPTDMFMEMDLYTGTTWNKVLTVKSGDIDSANLTELAQRIVRIEENGQSAVSQIVLQLPAGHWSPGTSVSVYLVN